MHGNTRRANVQIIPADITPNHKNIAIYCRVSTLYESQEESLQAQKAGSTEMIHRNPDWTLAALV